MSIIGLIYMTFSGAIIGVFGFLFIGRLIDKGEVFDFYPKLVLKTITGEGIVKDINDLPEWKQKMLKILLFCPKCFAGQLALWSYFIIFSELDYNTFYHFIYITMAVYTALYLSEKTFA